MNTTKSQDIKNSEAKLSTKKEIKDKKTAPESTEKKSGKDSKRGFLKS